MLILALSSGSPFSESPVALFDSERILCLSSSLLHDVPPTAGSALHTRLGNQTSHRVHRDHAPQELQPFTTATLPCHGNLSVGKTGTHAYTRASMTTFDRGMDHQVARFCLKQSRRSLGAFFRAAC
jgi:hypothetical protein